MGQYFTNNNDTHTNLPHPVHPVALIERTYTLNRLAGTATTTMATTFAQHHCRHGGYDFCPAPLEQGRTQGGAEGGLGPPAHPNLHRQA